MSGLVGFRQPSQYADYLIKPVRKAFGTLIIKEWPNIQRILASLAQKDVTQAVVAPNRDYRSARQEWSDTECTWNRGILRQE